MSTFPITECGNPMCPHEIPETSDTREREKRWSMWPEPNGDVWIEGRLTEAEAKRVEAALSSEPAEGGRYAPCAATEGGNPCVLREGHDGLHNDGLIYFDTEDADTPEPTRPEEEDRYGLSEGMIEILQEAADEGWSANDRIAMKWALRRLRQSQGGEPYAYAVEWLTEHGEWLTGLSCLHFERDAAEKFAAGIPHKTRIVALHRPYPTEGGEDETA